MKKICESVQNKLLLALDGEGLSDEARKHVLECPACSEFKQGLEVMNTGFDPLDEPSVQLDQAVLGYARQHVKTSRQPLLLLPFIVKYAAAASLLALLMMTAWLLARNHGKDHLTGESLAGNIPAAAAAWHGEELADALGETAAEISVAGTGFEGISTGEEPEEVFVADMIENELAQLQADVYLASLTFE